MQAWSEKKKLLLVIFIINLVVLAAGNLLFTILSDHYAKPRTFIFELPFPPEAETKYLINDRVAVTRVILAGEFSRWDPEDINYEMKKTTARRWELSLPLNPGRHEYKFVAYLSNGLYDLAWAEDRLNGKRVPNSVGTSNSLLSVPDVRVPWTVFNAFFLITLFTISGYILLKLALKLATRTHLPGWIRLVIYYSAVLLIINIPLFAGFISDIQSRYNQAFLSSRKLVEKAMISGKVGLSTLHEPVTRALASQLLREMIWKDLEQLQKESFQSPALFSAFILFDTNFDNAAFAVHSRDNEKEFENSLVEQNNLGWISELFPRVLFKDQIESVRKAGISYRNVDFYRNTALYSSLVPSYPGRFSLFQPYLTVIYPIITDRALQGWYGAYYRIHFWGNYLQPFLLVHIIALALFSLPVLFIVFNKRALTQPSHALEGSMSEDRLASLGVSAREKEIILLVAQGLSNKDIADKLFISRKTVDTHVYNIYQKTGVKNRIELFNLVKK